MELKEIVQSGGKIFGIVGSRHSGKTTALLAMVDSVRKFGTPIHTYFYHSAYKEKVKGVKQFTTLEELEQIKNSFIFIDEFGELLQMENRHNKETIKSIVGQVEHNNNILVFCGLPEYFNKMMGGFIRNNWILNSLYYSELVNGSQLKNYVNSLSGDYVGGTCLNIPIDKVIFNGVFAKVKYNKKYDKKLDRVNLFKPQLPPIKL